MVSGRKYIPFLLSTVIITVDQLTKYLVAASIPLNSVKYTFFDGFLRIIHVRNKAIAFSIGQNLPENIRFVLFAVLPLVILAVLIFYIIKTNELTRLQRWAAAGVAGGGFGNLIDRFFRPLGVVDFIDIRFYGLFGLERWPTFNIADSAIVVFGIILFISLITVKAE